MIPFIVLAMERSGSHDVNNAASVRFREGELREVSHDEGGKVWLRIPAVAQERLHFRFRIDHQRDIETE